jgi:FAD/FMN-containing dehydrogenase
MLPLGGAPARVSDDETVLGYRKEAAWNYHLLGQWVDPADCDRNIEWTRDFDAAMAEHALDGVYVNFVADPPDDVLERSFGHEKHERLVAVKDRYDPRNLFCFNQNIKPSGS